MRTYILSIPTSASCNKYEFKDRLVEENVKILKGEEFPATAFVNAMDLIGDPNVSLSDSICEKLFESKVLARIPHLDSDGKQCFFKKQALFHYTWSGVTLAEVSPELLAVMAWDLHDHPNFVHVSVVDDTPEKVLDVSEGEEYRSSNDDEPTEPPAETGTNEERYE